MTEARLTGAVTPLTWTIRDSVIGTSRASVSARMPGSRRPERGRPPRHIHALAAEGVAAPFGLGAAQPDPDGPRETGGRSVVEEGSLDRDRSVDAISCRVGRREEAVADRVDDIPSPAGDEAPKPVVVAAQWSLPGLVADGLREARRADDVRGEVRSAKAVPFDFVPQQRCPGSSAATVPALARRALGRRRGLGPLRS